jgi:hypothetical protein
MTSRLAAAIITVGCCVQLSAQTPTPALTKPQRELLTALVAATDAASAAPETDEATLRSHVLRASDGSHYVAFSFTPPAESLPPTPIVIYVRLATATIQGETAAPERSLVREWLKGSTTDPRLLPRRGLAVGDMPAMGAAAGFTRGGASAVGSPDVQIMNLEQDRARQRRDDAQKQRRSELDGLTIAASSRFPFEDFEVASAATLADGTRAIQRALTAGPGAYDLYVAWVDASSPAAKATTHVARRSMRLAPAAAEFGLSSLIVADQIGVRTVPINAVEQRGHPYTHGPTEITLAKDLAFAPTERLSVAFQIFNPTPTASGKPNVVVNPRIVRLVGLREEPAASLTPLTYDGTTMPEDFDLRLGHPIIAALAAPLATLRRGEYKLVITAEDRQAGVVASVATPFTITTTATGLLAEAPPLAQRLAPLAMLSPATVAELLDRLAVATPSPGLARALNSARLGRFTDLLIEDAVSDAERATRAVLSGLALLSIGDLGAIAQLQRAIDTGAPAAPAQYLLGAALSLQRRDADATAAWEKAAAAGLPRSLTAPLIANMWLVRGDAAAAAAAMSIGDATGGDTLALKILAATRIAVQRERQAVDIVDRVLAADGGDLEARWLLVRALFAELVRGSGERARFTTEAQRYVDAGGPQAALVRDWIAEITNNK